MRLASRVVITSAAALVALAFVAAGPVAAHRIVGPPPRDWLGVLAAWTVDVPALLAVSLGTLAYLAMVWSVNGAHPNTPWPTRRTVAWILGVEAVYLALLSPVDTFSDDLLSVHMVQHYLLTMVGPPLLAGSGVGLLMPRAARARTRKRVLLPILHSRAIRVITFPLTAWALFAGVLWGAHFSALFNLALVDDRIHAAEHVLFLATASLFWWPAFSPDPTPWRLSPVARMVYILSQMPVMTFLSVVVLNAPRLLYSNYAGRPELFGMTALADQQLAGGLMWILGDMTFLAMGAVAFASWVREQERATARVDAQLDAARRAGTPSSRGAGL